ncbi:MAG: hypothetical protein ABIR92_01010 [Gemmatimonadaceae bacterium]
MSSTQEKPLDLSGLSDKYDIGGEYGALGANRRYPARRKEDGRDVLITVLRASPEVAQGKAIAQFAADANLLASLNHPNVPQVIEGRWVGDDAFALVTDRIHGVTLAEMLKGERMTNPRVADILGDVDGVLQWARGERLSHRNVTPDSIWVERGTNRVFVSLSPTEAPKTNRPDDRDDARVIGSLAIAMLTARPMADDHDGTLIDMRPDLPQRVVDATEKVAACTINDESPNISGYLAALAMADAIKEGEVEVARVDAEFRAQMKAEREKWDSEQQQIQLANDEQVKKFGEERAEYERRSVKEREQLATARAEVDKRRTEVQEARAELDQARAAYKLKKSELEARAKQVDKHMSDLEKQKRTLEKRAGALERRAADLEQRNRELQDLARLAGAAAVTVQPVAAFEEPVEEDVDEAPQDDLRVMEEAIEAEEEVKAWTPIEAEAPWAVPLESDEPVRAIQYDAAAIPEPAQKGKRPAWMIPAGIAGAVLLIGGAAWGISRNDDGRAPVQTVSSSNRGTPPAAATPAPVRTDSAAGSLAPVSDSAVFTAIRDSIVAADEARRIRRARAAELAAAAEAAERARPRTYTDSTGTVWTIGTPPPVTRPDTIRPKPRPDTTVRVRPDTTTRGAGPSA